MVTIGDNSSWLLDHGADNKGANPYNAANGCTTLRTIRRRWYDCVRRDARYTGGVQRERNNRWKARGLLRPITGFGKSALER